MLLRIPVLPDKFQVNGCICASERNGSNNAINAVFDETKDGYAAEIEEFGNAFATEDMKEGTSAFLEKRKANFTGK